MHLWFRININISKDRYHHNNSLVSELVMNMVRDKFNLSNNYCHWQMSANFLYEAVNNELVLSTDIFKILCLLYIITSVSNIKIKGRFLIVIHSFELPDSNQIFIFFLSLHYVNQFSHVRCLYIFRFLKKQSDYFFYKPVTLPK